MRRLSLMLLLAFMSSGAFAANPYLDFDFEAPDCAGGWYLGGQGYQATKDVLQSHSGKSSLRFQYTSGAPWQQRNFGVATQQFPAEAVAGKKVRFSGYIRTENVEGSHAGLWFRVDGESGTLSLDNMTGRGPKGTTPWTPYQIEVDVPANAKQIYLGALLVGSGTAWVDSLAIEIDGVRWAEGPAPSNDPPPADAVAWVKSRAIPFNTAEAGNGFADLQPLKKMIGDARIVSLGEGTHGTREFFQMKHRLTEFLASEMGFTLFAIEANMPEAYAVNEYVFTGKGDPKELLKGMYFWTWDTQEVLDMIEWMRRFNQSGKGKIQFLGFDMQTHIVAAKNARAFVAKADPGYAPKLAEALTLVGRVDAARTQIPYGVAYQPFPESKALAGRKARLSGWIKTQDVTDGDAGFSWNAQGFGAPNRANTDGRGAKGTGDWQRIEIELPVQADAQTVNFGTTLKGKGTAWIDDLTLEIDGVPYKGADLNLGFEAADGLKGWLTGGMAYEVALDETVFRSGKRSLRIRHVGEAGNPQEMARQAAEAVRGVVKELEGKREAYAARFPKQEVDWAIQNARVVLQMAEMSAGEASRDKSMAKNVEWILQQAPGAKIVLWAHNGHVNKLGDAMGKHLADRFGKEMVVLGFALGEGRYTAVGPAGLAAHDATPPVASSVESLFRATGLPRFILDLRNLPADSPAAPWLAQSRPFRSIGAMAVQCAFTPTAVASDYDGVIYIDKTMASVLLR
ncbi:MAG TPA: erythromycin esterase family protein [Thermoanaerobaculia bacterium]